MPDVTGTTIAVEDLRLGLYIHLDLGWLDHPFPLSSFKITSQQQLDTLRGLGLRTVRYSPEKSEPFPPEGGVMGSGSAGTSNPLADADARAARQAEASEAARRQAELTQRLSAQQAALQVCERQYADSTQTYKKLLDEVHHKPEEARAQAVALVGGMLGRMVEQGESAIRLLTEGQGDRASVHAVNVTVLSLLLGQAMQLPADALQHLGLAALLHDIGKIDLPERVRQRDDTLTGPHLRLYQEHVARGVALGRTLALPPLALLTLSQHHEQADGSGFPRGSSAEQIVPTARILALVNRYDGLCNPPNPLKALTPHEALSLLFASYKSRFDPVTLNAFIRMMGVYPPGSLVQLTDGRYGLVASVNSARPLKPQVLVHEPGQARRDTLLLDLQTEPHLGVQRSLKADQLPQSALTFLAPRQRVCYYFERATPAAAEGDCA